MFYSLNYRARWLGLRLVSRRVEAAVAGCYVAIELLLQVVKAHAVQGADECHRVLVARRIALLQDAQHAVAPLGREALQRAQAIQLVTH